MNSLIQEEFEGAQDLRDQMMELITDEDLVYKLPGDNKTLGELCVEMGLIQQIYTNSFKTFEQEWLHQGTLPENPGSVASLQTWYEELDADLIEAVSSLSEEDIHNKQIDRGHGFTPTAYVHFQIYREALLIFYAKASIYLKALGKELTPQWRSWIG